MRVLCFLLFNFGEMMAGSPFNKNKNYFPFSFKIPSNVSIVAPSQAGKSTLMRDILGQPGLFYPRYPDKIFYHYGIFNDDIGKLVLNNPKIKAELGFPTDLLQNPGNYLNRNELNCLILDDLSNQSNKSEDFCDFLTYNARHCQCVVFSLEHNLFSNNNAKRKQATQWHNIIMLNSPRSHAQIKVLARQLGMDSDLVDYAYNDVTKDPYGHLLIDPYAPKEMQLLTNILYQKGPFVYSYCA